MHLRLAGHLNPDALPVAVEVARGPIVALGAPGKRGALDLEVSPQA